MVILVFLDNDMIIGFPFSMGKITASACYLDIFDFLLQSINEAFQLRMALRCLPAGDAFKGVSDVRGGICSSEEVPPTDVVGHVGNVCLQIVLNSLPRGRDEGEALGK